MYTKQDVIDRIGEYNWDDFETFILAYRVEYDEDGFEIYYSGDVAEFCKDNHLK